MRTGARLLGAIVFVMVTSIGAAGAVGPLRTADDGDDGDAAGLGRMVLLLDASGSMAEPAGGGQTKIQAARTALSTVIDGLPAEAEVGLRVFGATVFSRTDKGACTDSQLVVPPGTDNRSDLSAAVGDYKPYGETPIPYALQQAAKDLGDDGPRSIVLVSDGESTCDPDPCKVAADLERGGIDLQIDVVGLSVSGAARDQLMCIAENGNGQYYDAQNAGDIESRLTRVATRAVRPFTLDGEPIQGGTESSPTPITVGDWVDRIGGKATRSYVFERSTEGSTVRVSAVIQGRGSSDSLTIEIFDPGGERCDVSVVTRSLDLRDLIGVEAVAAPEGRGGSEGSCGLPGSYRITVTRNKYEGGVLPLGLRVTEEPPIVDPAEPVTRPEQRLAAPQVSGRAQAVEGGTSFAAATPITAGRWSSTIVPGEALLFRVPLELGQALRVALVFPSLSQAARDRLGGLDGLTQITIFNPMRGQLPPPDASEAYGVPDAATFVNATPWLSSDALEVSPFAPQIGTSDLTLAGDYYLLISSKQAGETVELPFTLDVAVDGEATTGPTYDDGASWSVAADLEADAASTSPTPSEEPTGEPDDASAAADQQDGGSSAVPIVVGVAAGVAVGVLATLLLVRRRRAT